MRELSGDSPSLVGGFGAGFFFFPAKLGREVLESEWAGLTDAPEFLGFGSGVASTLSV